MLGFTSLHNIAYQSAFCQPEKKGSSNTVASWIACPYWQLSLHIRITVRLGILPPSCTTRNCSKQYVRRMNNESRIYTYETLNLYTAFMSKLNTAHPARSLKLEAQDSPYAMSRGCDKQLLMWEPWQEWSKEVCGVR
jgi:hypothetical protein